MSRLRPATPMDDDQATQELTCKDCNTLFLFTVTEQIFYESKGLVPPKRCQACRTRRRLQREGDGAGFRPGAYPRGA